MGRIIHVKDDQIQIDWTCGCGSAETSYQQLNKGETLTDGTVVHTYCSECQLEHTSTWTGGALMIEGRYIHENRLDAVYGRFSIEQVKEWIVAGHFGFLHCSGYTIDGTESFGTTLSIGDGAGAPEYDGEKLRLRTYFRRSLLGELHRKTGDPDDLVEFDVVINVDGELFVSLTPLPEYRLKPVWATIDDKGEFPYVDIFTEESEAMKQIGSKDGDLTIVDIKPGACIVDRTGHVVDGTENIYFSRDKIKEVMKRLTSASVGARTTDLQSEDGRTTEREYVQNPYGSH